VELRCDSWWHPKTRPCLGATQQATSPGGELFVSTLLLCRGGSAEDVDRLLGDGPLLAAVGAAAAVRALEWDEQASGRELVAFVREAVATSVAQGGVLPRDLHARHSEL
jgi:hypothetical protein